MTEDDCNKKIKWLNDLNVNQFLETSGKSKILNQLKNLLVKLTNQIIAIGFGIINKETNEHIGNIKIGDINVFHKMQKLGILLVKKIGQRA